VLFTVSKSDIGFLISRMLAISGLSLNMCVQRCMAIEQANL